MPLARPDLQHSAIRSTEAVPARPEDRLGARFRTAGEVRHEPPAAAWGDEDALGEVVLKAAGDYALPCRKRSMMSATSLVKVSTALFASSRSGWIST